MTNKLLSPERWEEIGRIIDAARRSPYPGDHAKARIAFELFAHIAASAKAINRMADGLEVLANCGANACVIVGPNDELTGASTYASWVLEHPDVTAIRALKDKPHG